MYNGKWAKVLVAIFRASVNIQVAEIQRKDVIKWYLPRKGKNPRKSKRISINVMTTASSLFSLFIVNLANIVQF